MKTIYRIVCISTLLFIFGSLNVLASTFPDVSEDRRFYDEIMYLSGEGIITGFPSGEFKPGEKVTRAAAAIMIGRVLGYDKTQQETIFPDVPKDSQASGYIQQAYEDKIISGYPDGKFRPDKLVTRGEMAIFIARAYELTEEEVVPFSDVSVGMSSFSSIRKIIAFGVTGGYEDGTFKPELDLTREQFSAFLARAESEQFKLDVNTCGYDSSARKNPDYQTINCLITKAADDSEFPIPAEIVKAVASIENNGWKHFKDNGEPIISGDGGIGLMQITNTTGMSDEQINRLKYDLYYNIQVGISFLVDNFKRTDLPRINDHDPTSLESWYFAVMAYNGTVPANSPFYKESGERNLNAYQEKVYQELKDLGQLETNIYSIPMKAADFSYDRNSTAPIQFLVKSYDLDEALITSTKQRFVSGDIVNYSGSGIRSLPSTKGTLTQTNPGDNIKIIGEPVYDLQGTSKNQFVWYPVEIVKAGKTIKGYIASQYIVE